MMLRGDYQIYCRKGRAIPVGLAVSRKVIDFTFHYGSQYDYVIHVVLNCYIPRMHISLIFQFSAISCPNLCDPFALSMVAPISQSVLVICVLICLPGCSYSHQEVIHTTSGNKSISHGCPSQFIPICSSSEHLIHPGGCCMIHHQNGLVRNICHLLFLPSLFFVSLHVFLPALFLLLYQMKFFQKCLGCCGRRLLVQHTFTDVFLGCYKNGTSVVLVNYNFN